MPPARKVSAKPETIWSARRVTEKSAWIRASSRPANIPISRPITHEPLTSAPHRPQKAPISIMPSSPMLMTPLRSENRPPSAANSSGVA